MIEYMRSTYPFMRIESFNLKYRKSYIFGFHIIGLIEREIVKTKLNCTKVDIECFVIQRILYYGMYILDTIGIFVA